MAFLAAAWEPLVERFGEPPAVAWPIWRLERGQERWQWRYYMAQQIAEAMDMNAYGVQGIYLFDSTITGETGIGGDIDLLIHTQDDTQDDADRLESGAGPDQLPADRTRHKATIGCPHRDG